MNTGAFIRVSIPIEKWDKTLKDSTVKMGTLASASSICAAPRRKKTASPHCHDDPIIPYNLPKRTESKQEVLSGVESPSLCNSINHSLQPAATALFSGF